MGPCVRGPYRRIPGMDDIITQVIEHLRAGETVDDRLLVKLIHAAAKRAGGDKRAFAKRLLLPYYQRVKREEPERWAAWGITPDLERRLCEVLRMKPRRSASGVATITVITKPWPCSGSCIFCPNDIRCPKSYLHDEPACARAEQNAYDPYLQVSARLTALAQMGHATDKIELIVLGGTWSDYPLDYQLWFMRELFRALNDDAVAGVAANPALRGFTDDGQKRPAMGAVADGADAGSLVRDSLVERATDAFPSRYDEAMGDVDAFTGSHMVGARVAGDAAAAVPLGVRERRALYRELGLLPEAWSPERRAALDAAQHALDARTITYNEAWAQVYAHDATAKRLAAQQRATFEELEREQHVNEHARHRVVGLVVETRPDAITPERLWQIRRMGATKIQMGVQSVDQRVLDVNGRGTSVSQIARAFSLLRLFGFKIHAHAMVNLLGATPEADKRDYERFVTDPAFQPDEVKLYPCALIEGAALNEQYESGAWRPYTEDELVDVLCADLLATPAYCRVSRMIRDFSTDDIKAGNKKPNLRQLVEAQLRRDAATGSGTGRFEGEMSRGADSLEGEAPEAAANALRLGEGVSLPTGAGALRGAADVKEIRFREVATDRVDLAQLTLDVVSYETVSTREHFLQWVTPEGRIVGFLRLSLPDAAAVTSLMVEMAKRAENSAVTAATRGGVDSTAGADGAVASLAEPSQKHATTCDDFAGVCPIALGEAMIREVHVYGMAERVGERAAAAQHHGLGRRLVERACAMARAAGYARINVISAVGTREYYCKLGFVDRGLYQQKELV